MTSFSIRKFIPSSKTSTKSSPAESTAPEKAAQQGKPNGVMGMLSGLAPRRSRVHPEPARAQPRAESPSLSRPQTTARPSAAAGTPAQRPAPTMAPRQPSPSMRQEATAAMWRPGTAPVTTPAPKRQSPGPAAAPAAKRQRMEPASSRAGAAPAPKRHAPPAGAGAATAPAAKRQRSEPAPLRAQSRPARTETEELHGMLRELDALMAKSDKEKYRLDTAVFLAETDAEIDAAEDARDAFKAKRAELIAARKDVQARIAHIANPKSHESVQRLMQLGRSSGPRDSGGQRDIIRGNIDALRRDGGLLERRDELRAAQQQVRKSLASGVLDGLPKGELQELRALAALDIDKKLDALHDLKATVAHTEKQLKAIGAGGLFQGTPSTAKERAAWQAEELRKAQEALDNGY